MKEVSKEGDIWCKDSLGNFVEGPSFVSEEGDVWREGPADDHHQHGPHRDPWRGTWIPARMARSGGIDDEEWAEWSP